MRTPEVWVLLLWWLMQTAAAAAPATEANDVPLEPWVDSQKSRGPHLRRRGHQPHAKIVGGTYGKQKDFPYQVYLRVYFKPSDTSEEEKRIFCGGGIVGRRHIVTAAHCLEKDNIKRMEVVVGTANRLGKDALKFEGILKTKYIKKKSENVDADISVLMVNKPFPLGAMKVKPLPLQRSKVASQTECVVAGWGTTNNDTVDPNFLMFVKLRVSPKLECQKANPEDAKGDLLCAGVPGGGKDTCQGDSGGPLVCGGRLTGVVKGGVGCGLPGYPGTYTDVSYYWRWIKKIVARDEGALASAGRRTWRALHRRKPKTPLVGGPGNKRRRRGH